MRRTLRWAMSAVGFGLVCLTTIAMWNADTRRDWLFAFLGYLAALALTSAGLRLVFASSPWLGITRSERKRLEEIVRESSPRTRRDAHIPIRPLVAKPPSTPDVRHDAQPPR